MTRYAIYFSPAENEILTKAAAEWLGYNAWRNAIVEQIKIDGLSADTFWNLTESPRRYGFHATLKAPMRLVEGVSELDLHQAAQEFSRETASVTICGLHLKWIGAFLALVPTEDTSGLHHLAGSAVRHFARFRGPTNRGGLGRRQPNGLSGPQREYLHAWGYPYIFDEFRFHMTLTGTVPADQRQAVEAAAARHFSAWLAQPFPVDRIALFKQTNSEQPFHIVRAYPLGDAATQSPALPRVGTFAD